MKRKEGGENCVMISFFAECNENDQVNKMICAGHVAGMHVGC
jgi:hypothetical protein